MKKEIEVRRGRITYLVCAGFTERFTEIPCILVFDTSVMILINLSLSSTEYQSHIMYTS